MGIFNFWKKPKTDVERYEEERAKEEKDAKISLDVTASFSMEIEDVFSITGRGTVVTGKIASGTVTVGDTVFLHRKDGRQESVIVSGIELFRKLQNTASAGENVGILLQNIARSAVSSGDVLIR